VLAAGFGGGGIVLGLQANKYRDDLKKEIAAGNPPPDSTIRGSPRARSSRFAADAAYAVSGITALTAVLLHVPRQGRTVDRPDRRPRPRARPELGPGYAGLAMGVSW